MRRLLAVVFCAALSGAMFAAALPPADGQVFGWLCFVPLLISLRRTRIAYAILAPIGALLFGAYLTVTGVLYDGPRMEGEATWHYAGFMLFAFAIVPACIVWTLCRTPSHWNLVALAATFVCCESLLLFYLPAHLALTQYRSPVMVGLASWVGIWGVSFLLWLFQLVVSAQGPELLALTRAQPRAWLAAVPIGLVLGLGLIRQGPGLAIDPTQPPPSGMIRFAAIQTLEPDLDRLRAWNQDAGKSGARLVVWPELSAAGIAAGGQTEALITMSKDQNQPAFVTTFPDGSTPLPFNAASIFHNGSESPRYLKRKPFGGESSQHQAGIEPRSVMTQGMLAGLNICFDSCYPSVMLETAKTGPVNVIALPCMGPESPFGVIQAIHGAFTPFRSAEMGVPIVRGESSAFAMITDGHGRIVAEAQPGFEGVLFGDVEIKPRWTLIKVVGDWCFYASWLIMGGAATSSLFSLAMRKDKPIRQLSA